MLHSCASLFAHLPEAEIWRLALCDTLWHAKPLLDHAERLEAVGRALPVTSDRIRLAITALQAAIDDPDLQAPPGTTVAVLDFPYGPPGLLRDFLEQAHVPDQ